jgi:hypothetical protein
MISGNAYKVLTKPNQKNKKVFVDYIGNLCDPGLFLLDEINM